MTPYFEGLQLKFDKKYQINKYFRSPNKKIRNGKTKYYLFGIKILTIKYH
jgi:hypothetical protein